MKTELKMKGPPEAESFIATRGAPTQGTLRGLDWLNFLLADVQTGVGLALTVGGIAGILTQTPAGGLVDSLRSKRALVALAAFVILFIFMPETRNAKMESA